MDGSADGEPGSDPTPGPRQPPDGPEDRLAGVPADGGLVVVPEGAEEVRDAPLGGDLERAAPQRLQPLAPADPALGKEDERRVAPGGEGLGQLAPCLRPT